MMESAHPRHPSFGFAWEFVPGQDHSVARDLERMGFSHWSLRLETHLKYAGPLADFFEERARHAQVRFFSDYLPVAPASDWDIVHQLATVALLEKCAPARLTCRRALPQIPAPRVIIDELLARLPVSTEINLLVPSAEVMSLVRHSGEVSAAVEGQGRRAWWASELFAADVDLISEIRLDPLDESFAPEPAARDVCAVLEASRGSEPLDITFELPADPARIPVAARRAEELRAQVLSQGWSRG